MIKPNTIYNSDCYELLRNAFAESVDLIVTDPPYGYSFMASSIDWDKALIPVKTWKLCLRVLKPGAFAFIMAAPRQDVLSKMICNLKEHYFKKTFLFYKSYLTFYIKITENKK